MATQVLAPFRLENNNTNNTNNNTNKTEQSSFAQQQRLDHESVAGTMTQLSSPHATDLDAKLFLLEQFHQREMQLFKEVKEFFGNPSSSVLGSVRNPNGTINDHRTVLEEQIKELLRKKEETLNTLFYASPKDEKPIPVALIATAAPTAMLAPMLPPPPKIPAISLSLLQQPLESVVSNRYLFPSPTVQVTFSATNQTNHANLFVVATIVHSGTDVEVIKTVDGRHDVLQGNKRVSVDSSGKAVFGKLKVMEVSSKHKHQAFCFAFTLEEGAPSSPRKVLAHVRSNPFHVQSRPNKRKLTLSSAPSSPSPDQSQGFQGTQMKRARSSENFQSQPLSPCAENDSDEEASPVVRIGSSSESSSLLVHDYNYIDITDLLVLPQKDAARRLGISESMLCKRFKECTRRKWPYRYLRKIDKVINILNLHKSDGAIPKEDREKLERLTKERDECLRPVKIRITACDKLSAAPAASATAAGSSSDDEDEIPDDILETLGKMKSQNSGSP